MGSKYSFIRLYVHEYKCHCVKFDSLFLAHNGKTPKKMFYEFRHNEIRRKRNRRDTYKNID